MAIKKIIIWVLVTMGIIGGATILGTQLDFTYDGPINFPLTVNTLTEKFEYAYIAQERLRLQHNEMGAKFKSREITEEEWNRYVEEDFLPKSRAIGEFIAQNRIEAMKDIFGVAEVKMKSDVDPTLHHPIWDKIYQKKQAFKHSNRWQIDINEILK